MTRQERNTVMSMQSKLASVGFEVAARASSEPKLITCVGQLPSKLYMNGQEGKRGKVLNYDSFDVVEYRFEVDGTTYLLPIFDEKGDKQKDTTITLRHLEPNSSSSRLLFRIVERKRLLPATLDDLLKIINKDSNMRDNELVLTSKPTHATARVAREDNSSSGNISYTYNKANEVDDSYLPSIKVGGVLFKKQKGYYYYSLNNIVLRMSFRLATNAVNLSYAISLSRSEPVGRLDFKSILIVRPAIKLIDDDEHGDSVYDINMDQCDQRFKKSIGLLKQVDDFVATLPRTIDFNGFALTRASNKALDTNQLARYDIDKYDAMTLIISMKSIDWHYSTTKSIEVGVHVEVKDALKTDGSIKTAFDRFVIKSTKLSVEAVKAIVKSFLKKNKIANVNADTVKITMKDVNRKDIITDKKAFLKDLNDLLDKHALKIEPKKVRK